MCRERRFSAVRSIRFNDLPVPVCRTVRVPAGYPQGHLHHECHRIAEQRDPCGDKETQSVPDGRLGSEGCLSGDQGCLKKWSMPIQNWRLAMSRFIIVVVK